MNEHDELSFLRPDFDKRSMPSLQPCPFCGQSNADYDGWVIQCKVCYAKGPTIQGDEWNEAIEGWNTRRMPDVQPPDRPLEAGQDLREVQEGDEPVA